MNLVRHIWHSALIGLFAALVCPVAFTLEPDRTIAQLAHTTWGPKDGAPNVILALAQTSDGYLWLGSDEGLFRFDGVSFESYQPRSGGPLPARRVSSLLALPNGDLWVGFRAGAISLLRNGNASNFTSRDGTPGGAVWGFAQDSEGTIWAATNSGLARLQGKRWEEVGKDWNFPGKSARAIFLDRQGSLWVSTEDTLVFLTPGARRFRSTGIRIGEVFNIAQAASGKLWMAETTRSVRTIPLSHERPPLGETEVVIGSQGILFDKDGTLWITSLEDGLRLCQAPELLKGTVQKSSTALESFTAKDGLSDDVVLAILQDREGNVWVGTNHGLDRFRETNLVPVVLPFKLVQTVWVTGDAGDAWVANLAHIFRVHNGRTDLDGHKIPADVISAYRDSAGAIWWLCSDAIYRYDAERYTRIAFPPTLKPDFSSAMVATEDGSGALWLAAQRGGLFYRKGGKWTRLETGSDVAKLSPTTAFTDWMGRAWFGYAEGTIIVLKDGNIQRIFPPADSPVGGVKAIGGRGRHLWVGGELGLAFFDGNRFRQIIPSDGEAFGLVEGIEETHDGALWIAESRGVIRLPESEVHQALNSSYYRVNYRVFDSFDGLQGTFAGSGNNPMMTQGTDGRLWFGATDGVSSIDPARISTNALPPPVSIRSVKVDGKQLDPLPNLVLPPRVRDLEIDYTALSLVTPEKVRFRYRLDGRDRAWQEPGARRQAFYTDLWPGHYRFRVIACNNDGVWNETGTFLNFTIAPAWYQTALFLSFCALVLLFMLWSLYQVRLNQLKNQFNRTLEIRVDERTRIARELHDTLLQSFQGLTLHFQRARNLLPGRAFDAMQTLDIALDGAERAIVEGRDAIHDLRSPAPAARVLADEVTYLGEELASKVNSESDPMQFRTVVEGSARALRPKAHIDIFRIAREAIRNAFFHSQGRLIETEIAYTDNLFRLRVRDDGKGMDSDLRSRAERTGHWGLKGMRERAERLGGQLDVWSEPGVGTEIELRVPGTTVYEASSSQSGFRSFWNRKKSDDT